MTQYRPSGGRSEHGNCRRRVPADLQEKIGLPL